VSWPQPQPRSSQQLTRGPGLAPGDGCRPGGGLIGRQPPCWPQKGPWHISNLGQWIDGFRFASSPCAIPSVRVDRDGQMYRFWQPWAIGAAKGTYRRLRPTSHPSQSAGGFLSNKRMMRVSVPSMADFGLLTLPLGPVIVPTSGRCPLGFNKAVPWRRRRPSCPAISLLVSSILTTLENLNPPCVRLGRLKRD